MDKVGSPGFITKVHQKLANLKTLKYTIIEALKAEKCDKEKVVKDAKQMLGTTTSKGKSHSNCHSMRCKRCPYMKTLLSAAYKTGMKDCGVFVSHGLYQIVGEDIYKQKLQEHTEYVMTITTVVAMGLQKDAVWSDVKINKDSMMLEHYCNK
eukprot:11123626-Ditylum_brightwellii.AAC.1